MSRSNKVVCECGKAAPSYYGQEQAEKWLRIHWARAHKGWVEEGREELYQEILAKVKDPEKRRQALELLEDLYGRLTPKIGHPKKSAERRKTMNSGEKKSRVAELVIDAMEHKDVN